MPQNLIEKPEDKQVIKENCISMVQCKALKQLEFIEQKKFEDEDIQADIEFLKEKMEISLQDLRYTGIMNRMKSCDILHLIMTRIDAIMKYCSSLLILARTMNTLRKLEVVD